MPVLGILIGGINFTNLKLVLIPAQGEKAEVAILYGSFIQSVVDFLIIAFSIFIFIKLLTSRRKKKIETVPESPEPTQEVALLEEIRDLLKIQTEGKRERRESEFE
jgi:large conductance mechanosensitive channel